MDLVGIKMGFDLIQVVISSTFLIHASTKKKLKTNDNQWMIGQIVSFTKLSLQCGQIFFQLEKILYPTGNEHGSILAYFLFNTISKNRATNLRCKSWTRNTARDNNNTHCNHFYTKIRASLSLSFKSYDLLFPFG